MYLILKPVSRMSGEKSHYFESIWTDDGVTAGEYAKCDNVRVYKLDALTHIAGVNVTTQDIIA